jgi:hypothetical protein
MIQGQPLSAALPEDSGLGERFWYWRGASGQRYIHSIYRRDICPPVAGAVYVLVRAIGGQRRAVSVGRFDADGMLDVLGELPDDEEIHVHLLARDENAARMVLRDLQAAMASSPLPTADVRPYAKPIQLELLAA